MADPEHVRLQWLVFAETLREMADEAERRAKTWRAKADLAESRAATNDGPSASSGPTSANEDK